MSIKEEARCIKAYKTSHGLTSGEAYQAIYQRVCSKRTDGIIKKTYEPVLKATDFVNRIDDDELLIITAAILYMLNQGTKETPDTYSCSQHFDLSTMVSNVNDAKVEWAIQLLAEAGIVNIDLCGDLHLVY